MKLTPRTILFLLVPGATGIAAWLLLPGPFVHGIIVGLGAALASLALAGVIFFRQVRRRTRPSTNLAAPPLPDRRWDRVMALTDLAGQPFSFESAADRVIVLNLWATWCSPCIRELPSLERLMAATADLDVRFGFVTGERPEAVRAFVAKQGLSLPVYIRSGDVPPCFRTRGIPATFVIDRAGRIMLGHTGAAAWDGDDVVAFVRGLATRPL